MTKRTLKSLQDAMSAAFVLSDSAFVDPDWIAKHLAAADSEAGYPDGMETTETQGAETPNWTELLPAKEGPAYAVFRS